MGNPYWVNKSDNRRGGGRGRGYGGDRGKRQSEMHDAICDECGNECEVPFRPSGSKPVFCSQCFEKQGGGGRERGRDGGRDFGGNRNDRRQDRPRQDRSPQTDNNLKREIDTLNNKLDRIVELLTPIATAAKMMNGGAKKETGNIKQRNESKIMQVEKTENKPKKVAKKKTAKKKTAGKRVKNA